MRKILITEFMSLDGVFEAPGPEGAGYKYEGWSFPFNDDEFAKFKLDELRETDALLLGRVTYDGFAKAWPKMSGDEFSDKFNSMPKYVVSNTLKSPDWENSHIISENIGEEIKKLEGNITVHGSGMLSRFLIEQGLADELVILLYPIVLGEGKRLFDGINKSDLKLIKSVPFKKGIVALHYEPSGRK